MSKPKLIWHSNAPFAPTGYGNQTGLFLPELAKHYDVAASAFYGLQGAPIFWEGIPVYPGLGDTFGNEYIVEHAKAHFDGDPKAGITITLCDVWVIEKFVAEDLNLGCITPVDHDPAPPKVLNLFRESPAVPIAMTRHGQDRLGEFDPLYIPHMVNTDAYHPIGQRECREFTGIPHDAFLVGMVAANKGRPSRKGFAQAFEAFAEIHRRNPTAMLYLHTSLGPQLGMGEDLIEMRAFFGIPEDAVIASNQYRMALMPFSKSTMAKVYGSMDVLLNCSHGEGFGIPILEAQACGVPAIVTDWTAMPEVCGAGWHVKGHKTWMQQQSYQATPDVPEMVEALEACISLTTDEKQALSEKARTHALTYSVPVVMEEHCLPALKQLEARFQTAAPAVTKSMLAA